MEHAVRITTVILKTSWQWYPVIYNIHANKTHASRDECMDSVITAGQGMAVCLAHHFPISLHIEICLVLSQQLLQNDLKPQNIRNMTKEDVNKNMCNCINKKITKS